MDTLSFQVSYFYYGPDGKKKVQMYSIKIHKMEVPFSYFDKYIIII